jgi:mRNA-degrading endonuclease RelE of RelBE toxin-antitoxin system
MTEWRLVVASSAERGLDRVPPKVASAIVEFMVGPLLENPHRVGNPLLRELTQYRSARRGAYRIIYRINEEAGAVEVVRIDHRSRVYRSP